MGSLLYGSVVAPQSIYRGRLSNLVWKFDTTGDAAGNNNFTLITLPDDVVIIDAGLFVTQAAVIATSYLATLRVDQPVAATQNLIVAADLEVATTYARATAGLEVENKASGVAPFVELVTTQTGAVTTHAQFYVWLQALRTAE